MVRCMVLRAMCFVLGIVVRSKGERNSKTGIICANHVSALDHVAVELVKPCVFSSTWGIPSVVRWWFGYLDLGARIGHAELVSRARVHLENSSLPLLSFPEGAITSGRTGMLKFNSWPCEASSQVQPLAVRISRPLFSVSPSVLGSAWWADVAWFAFVPLTIYHLSWLPVMQRGDQETAEDFSKRVESCIAEHIGLKVTNLTQADAVEAAKRFFHSRSISVPVKKGMPNKRMLDEIAMRIKQSYPSVSILDIRMDLESTKDQQATIERIRSGKLQPFTKLSGKVPSDPSQWKDVFAERKWALIEKNRKRYLSRLDRLVGAEDQEG